MAKVLFKRYETDAEAQASNVVDGQFIVTKEGTSYTDYGTDRVAFGGTLDTQMSDSSINGVQNKVIKKYVDDGVQEAKDYVDGENTYSTTETVIGTWLGKPLYRKVLSFTTSSTLNSFIQVAHNISNVDEFTPNVTMAVKYNNSWYKAPNDLIIEVYAGEVNFTYYNTSTAMANAPAYAVLEYTKTTDV